MQADKGSFQQTAEIDCTTPYYHRLLIKDLTAKGIAAEAREALGRPLTHQDADYLFVAGRSYIRTSGEFGIRCKAGLGAFGRQL